MKVIRHLLVAATLGVGLVSCAQARVFVGVGIAAPAYPVLPAYVAPPVYYAPPLPVLPPPPPVYPTPVVVGYYGYPHSYGGYYGGYYGGWHGGYGYWHR
jgi:hypothetical protein